MIKRLKRYFGTLLLIIAAILLARVALQMNQQNTELRP